MKSPEENPDHAQNHTHGLGAFAAFSATICSACWRQVPVNLQRHPSIPFPILIIALSWAQRREGAWNLSLHPGCSGMSYVDLEGEHQRRFRQSSRTAPVIYFIQTCT